MRQFFKLRFITSFADQIGSATGGRRSTNRCWFRRTSAVLSAGTGCLMRSLRTQLRVFNPVMSQKVTDVNSVSKNF
jgi:hypothetical protein